MHDARTNIEEFTVRQPSGKPVRLDEWRWAGVLGFDEYLAHIKRAEAARAARAYTETLYVPTSRGLA